MSCRVCDGDRLEAVLDLGDQPHCNSLTEASGLDREDPRYPLRLQFCHDCTTVQIDYTVPKETMFSEYLYVTGTTETLRTHFRDTAERLVARLNLTPGDLVVDIGSNDGTWLRQFQDLGLRGLGVEPARNLAAMANASGVRTLNRFFNVDTARDILGAETPPPRLITAAGVFFHLEELQSATEGVAALCRAGAVFAVQAIYLREMLRQTAFDNIYHEHLTYWTLRSFSALLDRHGLEVFSADVVPIHGGSLELLIGGRGQHEVQPSVVAMREREAAERLGEIETYRAFEGRVREVERELLAILREQRVAGRTVYAFGAPAKGATMLNSFGITTDLVSLATERNPLKVGRWIPGARIPIVEEGSIPDPDAYLVLPWNFLGEFLRRNRAYLDGGGAFIVPIPRPRVITAANVDETLTALS